jgi:hypothetical protein
MATVTVIQLSDGGSCEVKRLGIFDMDNVGPSLLGPFVYSFTMANGQEVQEPYDIRRFTTPPQHPGVPEDEIVERSPTWHALLEWQTYKLAVVHEKKRITSVVDYVLENSRHVIELALDESDWDRIQTEEDWLGVVEAALVPELTRDILADTFRRHFNAQFEGKEVLDAALGMTGGSGGYDAIRVWEINAMSNMGYTEEQWAELSLPERARKVAAHNLPKLLEALETDKKIKELKAKQAAAK